MFPDRETTVMSIYREIHDIDYYDLAPGKKAPVAFFPGCTMMTYSSELTREQYRQLNNKYSELTLIQDCCGLPLFQLGLQDRGQQFIRNLKNKLKKLGIDTIITSCPNCFYQLRSFFTETNIRILTIYEALEDTEAFTKKDTEIKPTITVHDSCPDRTEGLYANQVRRALAKKGYSILEMKHNRNLTRCCGSGGQVSHFQPELAQQHVQSRVQEAQNTGAQLLTGYCVGCVLNFAKLPGGLEVKHVLNLLLDMDQDFEGLKNKAKTMFEGPTGMEHWEKVMAE